jgi:Uma2 family endonuclease
VPRTDRPGQYVEIEATPHWVLEVVSRSSVLKDTQWLRESYHLAGIPEYWLIDAQYDEVSFQILRRQRYGYVAVAPRGGWRRSAIFGRSFRLDRQKNRMGRWSYSLELTAS